MHGNLKHRLLVVRPADRWDETRDMFADMPVAFDFTEIIHYTPVLTPLTITPDIAAVVITSARAIEYVPDLAAIANLPVFCVGAKTPFTLNEHGFTAPLFTAPTIADLIPLINDHAPVGPILYIHGDRVRDNLSGLHRPIINHITYVSAARTALDPQIVAHIQAGTYGGVMFFSPDNARVFCDLLKESVDRDTYPPLSAFGLSPAVLECTHSITWARTMIATTPDMPGMVDAVRAFYA